MAKVAWKPYEHDPEMERLPRRLAHKDKLEDSADETLPPEPEEIGNVHQPEKIVLATLGGKAPNLISSKVDVQWPRVDMHAPVIDLDIPCRLLPSSTPEHYHLYIDRLMPWETYEALLKALYDAGLIQAGYLRASLKYKQSYVRWNTNKQKEQWGEKID